MRVHLDNCSALGSMRLHSDHGSAQGCIRLHSNHGSALGSIRVHLDRGSPLRCKTVHSDLVSALGCKTVHLDHLMFVCILIPQRRNDHSFLLKVPRSYLGEKKCGGETPENQTRSQHTPECNHSGKQSRRRGYLGTQHVSLYSHDA